LIYSAEVDCSYTATYLSVLVVVTYANSSYFDPIHTSAKS
jgi:hypothetical protein